MSERRGSLHRVQTAVGHPPVIQVRPQPARFLPLTPLEVWREGEFGPADSSLRPHRHERHGATSPLLYRQTKHSISLFLLLSSMVVVPAHVLLSLEMPSMAMYVCFPVAIAGCRVRYVRMHVHIVCIVF